MFLLSLPQTNTWTTWQIIIIYQAAYYSPFSTLPAVPLDTKMEVMIWMSSRPGERWPWQSGNEAKAAQEGHPSLKRLLPEQLPLLPLCSEYLSLFHAFHHKFFIPSIPFSMQNFRLMSDLSEADVLNAECRRIDSLIGSRTTPKIPRLPDFGESNPRKMTIGLGDLANLCCRSWFLNFDSQKTFAWFHCRAFYREIPEMDLEMGPGLA